jgi:hypothetical protein
MELSMPRHHASPLIAVVVAITVLGSLLTLAQPATAQSSNVQLYRSEQFGWFMFYDASVWQIEETSSEPGFDFVSFSDEEVLVEYYAFDAPGMTPGECVEAILNELYQNPAILEIQALSDEDEPPTVRDESLVQGNADVGTELLIASTKLIVTVDGDSGPFKLVTGEECSPLDGESTLLYRSFKVPAPAWNAGRGFDEPVILLHMSANDLRENEPPARILDENGSLYGLLDLVYPCTVFGPLSSLSHREYYVLARNVGAGGNFVIPPSAFVAIDQSTGEPGPFTFRGYVYPSMPAEISMALPLGEAGLLAFDVDPPSDLYFVSRLGEAVFVGSIGICGAGPGAAPIIVDME